jgi:kynurenine formamidase
MGLKDRQPTTLKEYSDYKIRFNNWGRWGTQDQNGTLNHISKENIKYARDLIKTGTSISCANPIATESVIPDKLRNPKPADHNMSISATGSGDYIGVSYHGFVNTHIDSLCHIFSDTAENGGKLYNGQDINKVTSEGAEINSVDNWKDGIITRGVLYDIPKLRGDSYLKTDEPIEGWDLEDWAKSKGINPMEGDAVLIRSGCDPFWKANPKFEFSFPPNTPGNSPSIIEYLYDTNAGILGWDMQESGYQTHSYPAKIIIHEVVIPHMGMPLLDNANLERLSKMCEETGIYEFFFMISPLFIKGGTGSPVNPIAIF